MKPNQPLPPTDNDLLSAFNLTFNAARATGYQDLVYNRQTLKEIIEAAIALAQEELDLSDDDVPPPSPDTPGARAA
jgi:hypothetical protein